MCTYIHACMFIPRIRYNLVAYHCLFDVASEVSGANIPLMELLTHFQLLIDTGVISDVTCYVQIAP